MQTEPSRTRRATRRRPPSSGAAPDERALVEARPGGRKPRAPRTKSPNDGALALFSTISHDLRAPLAAITMGTSFVLRSSEPTEANARTTKVLSAMLRSCHQIERLIRNFSDLAAIQAGPALRLGPHDLGETLALAAAAAHEVAEARRVTVVITRPEIAMLVTCDRDRILRALGHLLENAIAASPEGGQVELVGSVEDGGRRVCVAVTDHGAGLPADLRRQLFDRRGRAREVAIAVRAGRGFGLAVARGMAAAHGGELRLRMGAAGQQPGATLTLVVPSAGPSPVAPPRSARHR